MQMEPALLVGQLMATRSVKKYGAIRVRNIGVEWVTSSQIVDLTHVVD